MDELKIRGRVLYVLAPFLMWLGRLEWPFSQRLIKEAQVWSALRVLQPGDVLLCSIRGEPTNLVIPGEFTHTAVWAPISTNGRPVVEATGEGCHDTGAFDFFMSHDRVIVLRSKESNAGQRHEAADVSRRFIGLPYDIQLILDESLDSVKAVYCAEVAFSAHKAANPKMEFSARKRMGGMTVVPMDFYLAEKHWARVWDSKG